MCLSVILACLWSSCSSKMYTSDSSVPLNPDTSCEVRGRYSDSVVGIVRAFAHHCQQRWRPVALVHRHIRTHDSVWDPLGWPFMFSTHAPLTWCLRFHCLQQRTMGSPTHSENPLTRDGWPALPGNCWELRFRHVVTDFGKDDYVAAGDSTA